MIAGKSPLVLASASPRRSELLRNAGIAFTVQPAHVDESMLAGEAPEDYAQRLAREKARAIFCRRPQEMVLGADTIVVVDSQVLGKPCDAADAARMLRLLSGRSHRVITGVCLACPPSQSAIYGDNRKIQDSELETQNLSGRAADMKLETVFEDVRAEITEVWMRDLSEEEIQEYVASGEPMDKAGAYAIQGIASRWVYRIVGCYFNVVGLPVPLVYTMLKEGPCLGSRK
ncbi:MAG TPA: Maf family protein [Terriglobales bacterium]|nr:Maf family protein [Terriglobales bacterium]